MKKATIVLGEADRCEGELVIMLEKYGNMKGVRFSGSPAAGSPPKGSLTNSLISLEREMRRVAADITASGKPLDPETLSLCKTCGAGWLVQVLEGRAVETL